jgi:hypothetical protein
MVETLNLQTQGFQPQQQVPVVWVFTVVGETKLADLDCFVIHIQSKEIDNFQPQITIWICKQSGILMRTQVHQLIRGQWKTFTDTYVGAKGKAVAVLGTIPSLPLDMPSFDAENSKDAGEMSYELIQGNTEDAKSLKETGFLYRINQSVKPIAKDKAKALTTAVSESQSKSLDKSLDLDNAVEVELQSGLKKSHQIWSPNLPWAIYSNNGTCEARLVNFKQPQITGDLK